MSLEGYLADQYNRDLQDIRAIEQTLKDVGTTFAVSFDETTGCWPYELRLGEAKVAGRRSVGTSAMILSAIGKMSSRCTLRDGRSSETVPELDEILETVFKKAASAFSEHLGSATSVESQ